MLPYDKHDVITHFIDQRLITEETCQITTQSRCIPGIEDVKCLRILCGNSVEKEYVIRLP
jgi:hypothetical protein